MGKNVKGQICFVKDKDLGIKNTKPGKGHYVYVSDVDKNSNTCTVHTITSLESKAVHFDKSKNCYCYSFYNDRLSRVRSDMILPLAFDREQFPRWSGVSSTQISAVDVDKLKSIGNKKLSKDNLLDIQKFIKKSTLPNK